MKNLFQKVRWYWDWKVLIRLCQYRRIVNSHNEVVTILGKPIWHRQWANLTEGSHYEPSSYNEFMGR